MIATLRQTALALATALLVLTGCGDHRMDEVTAGHAELLSREDTVTAAAAQDALLAEVLDTVQRELGLGPWSVIPDTGGRAGCSDFPHVRGAESRNTESFLLDRPVPDEQWADFVRVAETVTARHGYDRTVTFVDRPGQHATRIFHPDGAYFSVGSIRRATVSASGGCHLTPEARAAPPAYI